ncbi:MAG: hypothetical protein AAF525_00230, partial [Pseudomonadota bacterium]
TVPVISAVAGSGINILAAGDVVIDSVANTTDRVLVDGTTTPILIAPQADVTTETGGLVLVLPTGSLTANDGDADDEALVVSDSGNVLVSASGDVLLNADVLGATSHLSLLASSLTLIAAVDVATTTGDIDVVAVTGNVTMDDDSTMVTGDGSVRIEAAADLSVGKYRSQRRCQPERRWQCIGCR